MKKFKFGADLFGNELPPHFDPAKNMKDFEKVEHAEASRDLMVKRLLKPSRSPELRSLGRKLSTCGKPNPCRSMACHVCMRVVRRNFAGGVVARTILKDKADWVAISLVPKERYSVGGLAKCSPVRMKNTLQKQISRTTFKDTACFGGLDFSLNLYSDGSQKWAPHWYVLMKAVDPLAVGKALRKFHKGKRAVVVSKLNKDDILTVATYMLKSSFYQKYEGKPPVGVRRECFSNGFRKKINVGHWIELAPLLDSWGFRKRIFHKGFW